MFKNNIITMPIQESIDIDKSQIENQVIVPSKTQKKQYQQIFQKNGSMKSQVNSVLLNVIISRINIVVVQILDNFGSLALLIFTRIDYLARLYP